MITLHDLHKQGGAAEAAVMAFGHVHPRRGSGAAPEPEWEKAEDHWRKLVAFVLKHAAPGAKSTTTQALRWAERAGLDLLLTFQATPGSRCPVCTGLGEG
ncbi:hypothetical protein [Kitasatospora sp. NPDC008115]|uniref:hypothetical protein n=1 Tax=Kitasatospora sp. NPDC008115 TaxID=3364022 RepID=UPI0036EBF5CD